MVVSRLKETLAFIDSQCRSLSACLELSKCFRFRTSPVLLCSNQGVIWLNLARVFQLHFYKNTYQYFFYPKVINHCRSAFLYNKYFKSKNASKYLMWGSRLLMSLSTFIEVVWHFVLWPITKQYELGFWCVHF